MIKSNSKPGRCDAEDREPQDIWDESGITIGYRAISACVHRVESYLLEKDPSLERKDLFCEKANAIMEQASPILRTVWQWLKSIYAFSESPKKAENAAEYFFLRCGSIFLNMSDQSLENLLSCISSQITSNSSRAKFDPNVLDVTTQLIKKNIYVVDVDDPKKFIDTLRHIATTRKPPVDKEIAAELLMKHHNDIEKFDENAVRELLSYLASLILSPGSKNPGVPSEFQAIGTTLSSLILYINNETRQEILDTLKGALTACITQRQEKLQ